MILKIKGYYGDFDAKNACLAAYLDLVYTKAQIKADSIAVEGTAYFFNCEVQSVDIYGIGATDQRNGCMGILGDFD